MNPNIFNIDITDLESVFKLKECLWYEQKDIKSVTSIGVSLRDRDVRLFFYLPHLIAFSCILIHVIQFYIFSIFFTLADCWALLFNRK